MKTLTYCIQGVPLKNFCYLFFLKLFHSNIFYFELHITIIYYVWYQITYQIIEDILNFYQMACFGADTL